MVRTGKSTDDLEIEMLNEQKLQGLQYAEKVQVLLKEWYREGFPAVHTCEQQEQHYMNQHPSV